MKKYAFIALILVNLMFFYGCSRPAAEVDGEKIPMKTFEAILKEKMEEHTASGVDINEAMIKDAVIQELIGERLVLRVAGERNITVPEQEVDAEMNGVKNSVGLNEFKRQLTEKGVAEKEYKERLRERLIIARFIDTLVPEDEITEDEMRDFYKKSPKPFINPRKVLVRMVQTATEEEARAILKEMKEKKSGFDETADGLKKEKQSAVSEYGWIEPSLFSAEIAKGLKKIKKGRYGGPFKGEEGYYMFRVKDIKEETVKSYEEAGDEIKNILLDQKVRTTLAHIISEKKKNASIKIYIH